MRSKDGPQFFGVVEDKQPARNGRTEKPKKERRGQTCSVRPLVR